MFHFKNQNVFLVFFQGFLCMNQGGERELPICNSPQFDPKLNCLRARYFSHLYCVSTLVVITGAATLLQNNQWSQTSQAGARIYPEFLQSCTVNPMNFIVIFQIVWFCL